MGIEHLRADRAGSDRIHLNIKRGKLRGEGPGCHPDSGLGNTVNAYPGLRLKAIDGSNIDYLPRPCFFINLATAWLVK